MCNLRILTHPSPAIPSNPMRCKVCWVPRRTRRGNIGNTTRVQRAPLAGYHWNVGSKTLGDRSAMAEYHWAKDLFFRQWKSQNCSAPHQHTAATLAFWRWTYSGVVMRGKCHGVLFFLVLSQQLGTETSRVVFTEWEAAQKWLSSCWHLGKARARVSGIMHDVMRVQVETGNSNI
jgi:hypothetical protein